MNPVGTIFGTDFFFDSEIHGILETGKIQEGGECMSAIKEKVIKMIKVLPENVTVDDIMAELYFKQQVDAGLKELDEGKGVAHEDVERKMNKWLQK